MLFPEEAKSKMATQFYDKSVEIMTETTSKSAEGDVVTQLVVGSTFNGNVRYEALGVLQRELGLTKQIDVAISCALDTVISVGDKVRYRGDVLMVTSLLRRDSHLLILGDRWEG